MTSKGAGENLEGASSFVAGHPGYFLLQFPVSRHLDGEEEVLRSPIVAWRVGVGWARPVTIVPTEKEAAAAILCPDGHVLSPMGGPWRDETTWVDAMLALRRR